LYELVTGNPPYRLVDESPAALEDAILEGRIVRASDNTNDRRTARALRGDLDAILARALAREPRARYSSVESFAADIKRYLDDEPVQARRTRPGYRLAKFLRRHRITVIAVAIVLAAVAVGFAVQAALLAPR
jgi:hypothetical protein